MNEFNVLERIEELRKIRNWSNNELAKQSKLPASVISNMFNRNSIPSVLTLGKICDGFGITLSQFFSSEKTLDLTTDQEELLDIWNLLDSHCRELGIAYLKGLAQIQ